MKRRLPRSLTTPVSTTFELETDYGYCEVYVEGTLNWCPGAPPTVHCLSYAMSPDEYYGTDAEFEFLDIDSITVTDEDGAEVELSDQEYEAARRFVDEQLDDNLQEENNLIEQAGQYEEDRWCNYEPD